MVQIILNYLNHKGQFGTRIGGGKDSAQPRYIYTKLSSFIPIMFNKLDEPLYKEQFDEGMKIEPNYYVPIIPDLLMVVKV